MILAQVLVGHPTPVETIVTVLGIVGGGVAVLLILAKKNKSK